MKLLFRPFLFVLLFMLLKESSAQIQDVKFTLFTSVNGITVGKINGMTRDKYGFLWLSDQSNRCIIKFDGSHMTRYYNDPQNPNSLGGYYPECLEADSSGNIWIGFYGMGLDKFDPVTNKFTHYRHNDKDPESLSNDFVTTVLLDHLGNVWVGNYGGLDLLDQKKGKFKHYSHRNNDPSSLSCDSVRALYEDKAGELWVGTGFAFDEANPNGGLNHFHRNNGAFTRYMHDPKDPHSLIANKVRAIFEDSYGNFWVGTNGDGLHTMDRKTGQFTRYPYNPSKPNQLSRTKLNATYDHITFITEDADKKIWIGTVANGIIHYDPISKKVNHYGSDDDKKRELKDQTSWWANATPDGLIMSWWANATPDGLIMSWWANATPDGLIWISTQDAHLYKVDIYNATIPFFGNSQNTDDPPSPAGTFAFAEVTDSVFLFGTRAGLIQRDFKNAMTHRFLNEPHNPNSLSSNVVMSVVKDTANNFWLGTASGLDYFNQKTGKFIRYYPDSINTRSDSNFIFKLCKDWYGNLWLCTGGGLFMFNPITRKFIHYIYSSRDEASNNNLSVLADGDDLWIGTASVNGLVRMNLQTIKSTYYLSGLEINCIYKDANGELWIGTSGGLYYYREKTKSFNSIGEENLRSNIIEVRAITEDNENNLWVSSESGIYKLNKKRNHIIHLGKEYGIPDRNNFFYTGSSFTSSDGEVYFGNIRGYYAFLPQKLKLAAGKPQLYFTGFWLDNKQILPDSTSILKQSLYQTKEIRLHHDQNVFAFSATIVAFRNVADNRIYYKLENYDVDWRITQAEDKISYFKVPPGNYTFHIKTANGSNDDWIERSIDVIVLPPWWKTWWAYCIYGILFCVLVFAVHRYQKERVIKAEREKARIRELAQAKEIEKAYQELKTTQALLIQSEKMASLGQLTAGIAHEIQNPLNFVNNFSEINTELINEMKEALDKDDKEEVITISSDIKDNLLKILHHGKRADSIVKGMLQHSRASTGKKELTDINALVDECVRLSFHGMRAKDKEFSAEVKTDLDDSIGKINIVPQDISRVLLNLLNNAFYVVDEKWRQLNGVYKPVVSVCTKKLDDKVEVHVKDNGNGIPQNIVDKIFQPFFTTKPTGQGTGLGLSLSYDIVKAHGGEIKVDTKEGEGTEFITKLPYT